MDRAESFINDGRDKVEIDGEDAWRTRFCAKILREEISPYPVMTIGVAGTGPGCGKDTVADMINKRLLEKNIISLRRRFATALKKTVSDYTGIVAERLETVEGKNIVLKTGKTVGQTLQLLGDSLRSLFGDMVFVDAVFGHLKDTEVTVISDVRYKQEHNAVRARRGFVVFVKSNRCIDARQMAGRSTTHSSENDLNGLIHDAVIENNGSKEELEQKVNELVDRLYS